MAEEAIFTAKARERAGKGAARAVRREGLVPAVVYGDNKPPQSISIDPKYLMKQLHIGALHNTIYTINVEGGQQEKALPRDVQFHPVTDAPLHVDFLRLQKGSKINVMTPVTFINEEKSPGLKGGGILTVQRDEVELMCPVDDIPSEVICDLAGTEIGDTLRISNVALPDGVTPVINDRDFVVAAVAAPKVAAIEEDEDADDAEGEGEEAETEEE